MQQEFLSYMHLLCKATMGKRMYCVTVVTDANKILLGHAAASKLLSDITIVIIVITKHLWSAVHEPEDTDRGARYYRRRTQPSMSHIDQQ